MILKNLTKQLSTLFITLLLIIACSNDDSGENIVDTDPQTTLEEEREETTIILTNNAEKTWRISNAILINESGTIEISNNFNVVDDEFIFSTSGNLEWRPRNDINAEGTNNQETLLDYYRSPETTSFIYNSGSSTELTALNGKFTFTVNEDETITGILTLEGKQVGGELNIILSPKLTEDYPEIPLNGLTFTEAFTFEASSIVAHAPGLIGSYSDNSLFFVDREDGLIQEGITPERIIKFNINTGTSQENLFYNSDYVSKQLHIVNNQLIVIGGQYVNTYPLDLSEEPTSVQHGLAITRFGMAISDDDAYLVGGDLDIDMNQIVEAEKIYKWNIDNQSLEYFASMPEDRFGARSTIVNNKLYVFGGTTEFAVNGTGNTSIYIYDIESGAMETESMTSIADYTYVDKFQNLIYVAGRYAVAETDDDWEFFVGVYDTENGTYQEIPTNLSHDSWYAIHGMCVLNNKMYVIYGLNGEDNGGQFLEWQIMAADIN